MSLSPLANMPFLMIVMGNTFRWDRSAFLHSVQKDCGTRAPTEKMFKLMNQMFREHAGESVWEYWSSACASFADLLLQYHHGQHN